MNVLVLGGTRFLGRHLVEALLARGHAVTLFHRGRSGPDLFPQAERLHGDRDGALQALRGRRWDAAVDTCGYVPRVVRQSVRLLARAVRHYVFVSSISVYPADLAPGADEQAPTLPLRDAASEDVARDYGALKAACEREVAAVFGPRALVVRPGLIVGPHDPTGRFTYWPLRLARGGTVLAPGDPNLPVQLVDARDLAGWIVGCVERGLGGVFNATGPERPLRFGAFLEACAQAVGSDARFEWVAEDFLLARGVQPWTELPLWLPAPQTALARVAIGRALAAGLALRPLEDTARDTLAWARTAPGAASVPAATMTAARERDLLAAWAACGP